MAFRPKFFNITVTVLSAAIAFAAYFCFAVLSARAFAEEQELGSVAYLDYALTNPKAVYADGEVVAVSQENGTVFFYDGKIYERNFQTADQQIVRNGDYLYYTYNSLLKRTRVGVFDEEDVTDGQGNKLQIAANAFSLVENRLITLTNTDALLYADMYAGAPVPYPFDAPVENYRVRSGNVYSTLNADYFALIEVLYENGTAIYSNPEVYPIADYMTDVDGTLYFSNRNGISRLKNGDVKQVYVSADVKGVCGYKSGLLFIDGKSGKIMRADAEFETVEEFHFDVKVDTDAAVPPPASYRDMQTVTVQSGSRIHLGRIENGAFNFTETVVTAFNEDYIKIGCESGYAVLFGNSGYAFIADEYALPKTQNTALTFEKGLILHDCASYDTCLALKEREIFSLKKGDEVTLIKAYEMNGVNYILAETANGLSFVPAGEITENLASPLPVNVARSTVTEGKNNVTEAVVIMLLSTAVLLLALFVILIKKEYVKL
ncbi:MAG: hypothetical protein J6Z34_04490 [Clostridia bacterium]|nr:hypothetical protein [Clostridia bacterium]